MRHKLPAVFTAVLVILAGALWEWPVRALGALGTLMTLLDVPSLYKSFVGLMMAHPNFVVNIAPWVMMGMGTVALGYLFVWPVVHGFFKYEPLQIVFEPTDKFVKPAVIAGRPTIRFFVGMHNARRDKKTILFANLRAHDSEFTREVLTLMRHRQQSEGDLTLTEPIMLDAGATHCEQLFGVDTNVANDKDTFWGRKHRFTLDARGRDLKVVEADFEFDAKASPMLRLIEHRTL